MTLPPDLNPATTTGLQTWPLKNRVITTENVKKTVAEVKPMPQQYNTLPGKTSNSFLDEVALEEKRLINALKNGDILTEEPPPMMMAPKPKDVGETATKWGLRNSRRPEQQVPHPELTITQKQHLRQTANNPVRPFLTRGSVAERVLIFERCPSDLLLDKRARAPAQISKPQVLQRTQVFIKNL